jgi:hypothetical protein
MFINLINSWSFFKKLRWIKKRVKWCLPPCKVGDFWITPLEKISFRFPPYKIWFSGFPPQNHYVAADWARISTWQKESPRVSCHVGKSTLKKIKYATSFNDFFLFFFTEILLIMLFLKRWKFLPQGDSNRSPLTHGLPPLPLDYARTCDNWTA